MSLNLCSESGGTLDSDETPLVKEALLYESLSLPPFPVLKFRETWHES